MQGKDGSQIHKSDEVKRDEQAGAGRRAGAASAFSRHPDLAEAPVATDSTDEADASPAPQRQNSATAAPAFVPLPVTPAVERMLQARHLKVLVIAIATMEMVEAMVAIVMATVIAKVMVMVQVTVGT